MSSEYLSDLEKKDYRYNPATGQVTGSVDAPKYIYDPKTGKCNPQ